MNKEEANPSKAIDFDFLRAEGIKMLQKMSGGEWTDYNLHDPGVTILEYLCFAITDLAYRTNFEIEDLITQSDGTINYAAHSFVKPEQALTSGAVTLNDFRKIFLDGIEDIANIWIYPVTSAFSSESIKGLYEFYVQVNREQVLQSGIGPVLREQIRTNIQRLFVANRNLCEDASKEIHILEPFDIIVNADIVINQDRQPEGIMAQIYDAIERFLNPKIRSFTEKELLNRNYSLDEIYSGPMLKRGFIPDSELRPRNLNIDPSELTEVISKVKGVLAVNDLTINDCSVSLVTLNAMQFPYFNVDQSRSAIRIFSNDVQISVKQSLLEDILHNLKERADKHYVQSFSKIQAKAIQGEYKGSNYYSIQNLFPAIYGIGPEGLSGPQDAVGIAHARQLKAYLVFFEQVMANYLAQLNGLNRLFSNTMSPGSYLTQPLSSIPNLDDIISDSKNMKGGAWKEYFDNLYAGTYSDFLKKGSETSDKYITRKHQMLDHLLARFNEELFSYPVQIFDKLYGKNQKNQSVDHELSWKSGILQHVDQLSRSRSLGFNYLGEKYETSYDFRKKIYELLYIKNGQNHSLVSTFSDQITVNKSKLPPTVKSSKPESNRGFKGEDGIRKLTTITSEEFNVMQASGIVEAYQGSENGQDVIFPNQPISFLKHALNIDSYRLVRHPDGEAAYLLLYYGPENDRWYVVNRYSDYEGAISGLDELIDLLIKTSTDSEGLYLIEHILLRPRITANNFGFRYYDDRIGLLLESRSWYTFREREAQLQKLLDMFAEEGKHSLDHLTAMLLQGFTIRRLKNEHLPNFTVPDYKRMEVIVESIQQFIKASNHSTGRFEMTVKLSESIVTEDFFNFRMSIILPEWPARFQEKAFKDFIVELFQVQTPVHLRLSFYWLNITQMKVFEEHYALWNAELKANSDSKERMASANMFDFLKTLR